MYIDAQKQAIHTYNHPMDSVSNMKIYEYDILNINIDSSVTFLWIMEMKIRKNEQIPLDYFLSKEA